MKELLKSKKTDAVLLFVIIGIGIFRYIKTYYAWLPETPWPDVSAYMDIAKNLASPYETGTREPLWIWYVWIFVKLFGETRLSLAMMGAVAHFISAFFLFHLIKELVSDVRHRLLALFLFLNNGLILVTSINATRDCLFLSGLMSLTYFIFFKTKNENLRLAGLILSSLVLVGIRSTTLIPLFAILLFFSWYKGYKPYTPFLCLIVAFLFNSPFYYLSYQSTGDAFYSSNIHAVWWRNHEFSSQGNYNGQPITWFDYIFKLHSIKDLIIWTWDGLAKLFFLPGPLLRAMSGAVTAILYPVYWIGLLKLLVSKQRVLFVIPLLIVNVLLFTVHLNMDTRLFTSVVPFTILAMALGAISSYDFLFAFAKKNFPSERIYSHEQNI